MSEELKYARYRYKKVDDGDSVVDCDDEWVDICKLLDARVAELEAERTTALDMVRDRIDADPSTMTEAVDGLLKLYKMEFDERLKLQAQLDRANTSLKDWKQRAARMALKAKPLLDRATEPRADGESDLALMTELANTALEWQERAEKAERRLAKPCPMSEAPRDGSVVNVELDGDWVPINYDPRAEEWVLAYGPGQILDFDDISKYVFRDFSGLPTSSGGPVPHDYVDRDGIDECSQCGWGATNPYSPESCAGTPSGGGENSNR